MGSVRADSTKAFPGPHHWSWKGDAARADSKRGRARRRFGLGVCEDCGRPATDRHHRDGDPGNNVSANIAPLCRRCHMAADGRLDVFRSTSASRLGPQPARPCCNCQRPSKPLRMGRCHACDEYLRRRGVERPYVHDGRVEKAGRQP